MIYIIRAKAVSECLGIRRANITYFLKENKVIDLTSFETPLKTFKSIEIDNDEAICLDSIDNLKIGEEIYFYKQNKVSTSTGDKLERNTLGLLLMPLDINMLDYYQKAINDGYVFDQWNGEFEYLIGLMYELCENDMDKANEWYERAIAKKFDFKMIRR